MCSWEIVNQASDVGGQWNGLFFLFKMSSDYYMEHNNTGLSDLQLKMQ